MVAAELQPSYIAIYRRQAAHFFVLPDGHVDITYKICFPRQWFEAPENY